MVNYFIFILRCWQEGSITRFRLENPQTGETHLFAEFADLERFMQHLLSNDATHTRSNHGEKDDETE